jgi:DNA-binding NarL/FixJ family response regulator
VDQQQETTFVLVDDHPIFLEGIAKLCTMEGLKVIGQCGDGEAAVEMVINLKPDFAIINLHMPKMNGIEAIRKLRSLGCTSKLMILTCACDENALLEALRAGADAYILKYEPSSHLLDAINVVREGGVWISPSLRGAGLFARREPKQGEDPLGSLTPRELQVYSYLVNGLPAKDIADLLEISPKTVDTYRASLMRKLNPHALTGPVNFVNFAIHGPERIFGFKVAEAPAAAEWCFKAWMEYRRKMQVT